MSFEPRTPASIRKDRLLAALGIACMCYPMWFCGDDLMSRTIDLENRGVWIDSAVVLAGIAAMFYFVGTFNSLQYPEYRAKAELLDQLDDGEYRIRPIPWGLKIPGFYALLVTTGLAAFVAFLSVQRFGIRGNALNTANEFKVILMLPTAATTAWLILRGIFKTRIAPAT